MSIHDFLRDAVIILAAATVAVLAGHRLRTPAVVGFLLIGVLIGPAGLALIADMEQVQLFAEIGVVFLLFTIGLEFSLERLQEIRRPFLVGGSLQSLLTIAVAAGIALGAGMDPPQAIFLGFLLALSSTAIVLKLYADRREIDAPQGKLVIGILLFQDFLIVPMIVLTPVLSGRVAASLQSVLLRFGLSLAMVAAVFVLARYLMPKLLDLIVRTQVREVLVLGALLICLGMAWFTDSLRFSLALGAFLAGIVISESEYSHQIVAEVLPFRDVFNSIFFISIGMLLDLGFAMERAGLIAALALLIIGVKTLAAAGAATVLGLGSRIALIGGLSLAQIGEFSFVLLQVGQQYGMLPVAFFQTFIAASVLTMMATPLLVAAAPRLAERVPGLGARGPAQVTLPEVRDHVVIVGYGVNGRNLSRVLREASIPYRVVELNPELGRRARREGEPVLFGDATRREILERAGIRTARVVVFAISDLTAVRRSIRFARELQPGVHILVRTRAVAEVEGLRARGADEVIAQEFETSIEIFTRVLRQYHVPGNIIRAQTRALRGEDYQMLRMPAQDRRMSEALLRILAQGITDVYVLSPAHLQRFGTSIRALALREQTGATVIAVVRGQQSFTNPKPDLELADGDNLVLVGSHADIERAFDYLDEATEEPLTEEA